MQAQKAECRPAQSQPIKLREQHLQAGALKLQARMMDSRKGGIPTARRPDGGSTSGVFYGKKEYARFSQPMKKVISEFKTTTRSSRSAGSAACYDDSQATAASIQRRSVDGDSGLRTKTQVKNAKDNSAAGGGTRTPVLERGHPVDL